eukprot:NODE_26_length_4261_cov_4.813740.p1 GENE.NODE_26_length_4261_cov_4.813740~~NODE_26_length_4261_cov_4.813740.p1  ORF type:complete len:1266 (+),score=353.90 NODE_26_length_4261_cov_4.813740:171-3800(+)
MLQRARDAALLNAALAGLIALVQERRAEKARARLRHCAMARVAIVLTAAHAWQMKKLMLVLWCDDVVSARLEKHRAQEEARRALERRGRHGLVAKLFGAFATVILQGALAAWTALVLKHREERVTEMTRHQLKDAHISKTAVLVNGLDTTHALREAYIAWCGAVTTQHLTKQREMAAARSIRDEQRTVNLLSLLKASQQELLLLTVFTTWFSTHDAGLKQNEVAASKKATKELSSRWVLASLCSSIDSLVLHSTFAGWHQLTFANRSEQLAISGKHQLAVEKLKAEIRVAQEAHRSCRLASLATVLGPFSVARIFAAWLDAVPLMQCEQVREKLMSESAARQSRLERFGGTLVNVQNGLTLRMVLMAWASTAVLVRHDVVVRDLTTSTKFAMREKAVRFGETLLHVQSGLTLRVTLTAWASTTVQVRHDAFARDLTISTKREVKENALRFGETLFNIQSSLTLSVVLTAWASTTVQVRHDAFARDLTISTKREVKENTLRFGETLFNIQSSLTLSVVLTAWATATVQIRHEGVVEDLTTFTKRAMTERTLRFTDKLFSTHRDVTLMVILVAWGSVVAEISHKASADSIASTAKRSKDANIKHMLAILMASEVEVLLRLSFASWRDLVSEQRMEKQVEELRRHIGAQRAEGTRRIHQILLTSHTDGLMQLVLNTWREDIMQVKFERANIETRRKEEKRQRTLQALAASHAEVIVAAALAAWKLCAAEARAGREQFTMKDGHLTQLYQVLVNSEDEVRQRVFLAAWHTCSSEGRAQREIERVQQALNRKGDVQTSRMLMLLAATQDAVLSKAVFAAWLALAVESRQRVNVGHIENTLSGKREAASRRMLVNMVSKEAQTLARIAWCVWCDLLRSERQERFLERTRDAEEALERKSEESATRMLRLMIGSSVGHLARDAFNVWHKCCITDVRARDSFESERVMAAAEARACALIERLAGAREELVLARALACWHVRVICIKDVKASCTRNAVRDLDILMVSVIAAWWQAVLEARAHMQLAQLQHDGARMVRAACEQESDIALLQESAAQAEVEHSIERMRLLEQLAHLRLAGACGRAARHGSIRARLLAKAGFDGLRAAWVRSKRRNSTRVMVARIGSLGTSSLLRAVIFSWRQHLAADWHEDEQAVLREENIRMMHVVHEQDGETARLKEEICRLMEENLDSSRECRRLREESLHYAQQCRHLIIAQYATP